ncbi:hypothetical protein ACS0TY_004952 [Phlomoides rotata]
MGYCDWFCGKNKLTTPSRLIIGSSGPESELAGKSTAPNGPDPERIIFDWTDLSLNALTIVIDLSNNRLSGPILRELSQLQNLFVMQELYLYMLNM